MFGPFSPYTTSPDSFWNHGISTFNYWCDQTDSSGGDDGSADRRRLSNNTPVPSHLMVLIVHWQTEINSVSVLVYKRRAAFKFSDHLERHSAIHTHIHKPVAETPLQGVRVLLWFALLVCALVLLGTKGRHLFVLLFAVWMSLAFHSSSGSGLCADMPKWL